MKIIELTEDMAGKWRARVDLGDETQYFKFQTLPTDEEILTEANNFVISRNLIQAKEEEEREKEKTVIDSMNSFNPLSTTKAQAVAMSQLLIDFIDNKYGTTN